MAKYRVLAGKHIQGKTWYGPGDVVESRADLIEKFGASKFALVEGGGGNAVATVDRQDQRKELESLSVKELREFAESEEIDVTTCSRKDEYVNAILAAFNERG
jgi:hypothetical protein